VIHKFFSLLLLLSRIRSRCNGIDLASIPLYGSRTRANSTFIHSSATFSSLPRARDAQPDVVIVFRSRRKNSSRRSRARSFLHDVLNVLLNAAIVSATVHRARKFASAVPSCVRSSVGASPPFEGRRTGKTSHVAPSFRRGTISPAR